MKTTLCVILFLLAVASVAFVARKIKQGPGRAGKGALPAFKHKPFLTANELEFLSRLEAAAPELRFHAEVSMGTLIDPAASRKDGKEYFRARGMFSQKIVDYVAQRPAPSAQRPAPSAGRTDRSSR